MKALTADGRGRLRLLVLAVLVAALALTGAAKIGNAATTNGTITASMTVLNDQPTSGNNGLILGQPTPGGNIGYVLHVLNDPALGTSTVNHILFTDSIVSDTGAAGTVVYINAPPSVTCTGLGKDTLSCSSDQLASGASFDVTVLFQTPNGTPGTGSVTNNGSGTYAPQSNNSTNNRPPSKTFAFGPTTRNYAGGAADPFLAQSLLLPLNSKTSQGQLAVGGAPGQSSSVVMPAGFSFLNGNAYVGTTLETFSNQTPPSGCPSCQPFLTQTNIPLAATFTTTGPFWDGSTSDPYSWTLTIPIPNSFKPTTVYHTDDQGNNGFFVPLCSVTPVTSAPGICMTAKPTVNKKVTPNTATYTGVAVINGHGWGG